MLEESLFPTGSAIFAPVLRPVLPSAIAPTAASAAHGFAFRWREEGGATQHTFAKAQ